LAAVQAKNLLNNGSFDSGLKKNIPVSWGTEYYNSSLVTGRSPGSKAILINNAEFKESMGAQEIPLDQDKIKRITVTTQVKGENIEQGAESWMKGNLQVLFFDQAGNQVGGWPELGPWIGTFGWTKITKGFIVPKGAKKVKVVFGLNGAKGKIYFDEILLTARPKTKDPNNLIASGDFGIWEDWAYGGSTNWQVFYPGYKGEGALRITNDAAMWSFASQSIPLNGQIVKKIKVEGNMKVENVVPGGKPWQQARINLEFKARSGKRIDGWPIVAEMTGTSDWKHVSGTFDVPAGTSRVDVFAGLLECAGAAYFDNLKMEGFDQRGNKVKIGQDAKTNTASWFKFNPPKTLDLRPRPTSRSSSTPPPASTGS